MTIDTNNAPVEPVAIEIKTLGGESFIYQVKKFAIDGKGNLCNGIAINAVQITVVRDDHEVRVFPMQSVCWFNLTTRYVDIKPSIIEAKPEDVVELAKKDKS